MLYGLLGSKELVQRTYKNLEQKVLLECDGTKIPLKNVQGIVVLNIPSYTGGVNFWGHNSKDENVLLLLYIIKLQTLNTHAVFLFIICRYLCLLLLMIKYLRLLL
jgi:hypothetical protein